MDAKTGIIKRVPLFEGSSRRELRRIAALADEIDVPAGTTLTAEGATGREFVVLVEGVADVTRNGEVVNTVGPGEFVGEISLVTGERRTATVTTRSPAKLLLLNAQAFRSLVEGMPDMKRRIAATAALRLAG